MFVDYRYESRADALAAVEYTIAKYERLQAINDKWLANGDIRPALVKNVNTHLQKAREDKAAILALSDEEWLHRHDAYMTAQRASEAQLEALWEGEITVGQFLNIE